MTGTAVAALFAFLHHLAAFGVVGALAVQLVFLKGELTLENARRLQAADKWLGMSAGILLAVGLARVFHFEKGASYYFQTWTFIAKLGLFALVALLSVFPTLEFLSWRGQVKQGRAPRPAEGKLRRIRAIVHGELAGIVLILLFAALMAKGIGSAQ
jgi:putative membrane protein